MLFSLIARLVNRHGWLIVLFWVGIAVAFHRYAPSWESVSLDDDVRFFPSEALSVHGQELMERGFPKATESAAAVVVERPDGPLSEADRAFVAALADRLKELAKSDPNVAKVTDLRDPFMERVLVGGDGEGGSGQAALTLINIDATYISKQARLTVNAIERVLEEARPEAPGGLNIALTGSAVVGHDINEASLGSIDTTTYATVLLVVVILLLVYRSPLLAMIPLVTIALSVFIALKGLPTLRWVPGLEFQVIKVTRVFVIVVLFGAGTDYCLFLIARYREELSRGRSIPEALTVAIRQVGAALVASAGTVIVGLGMLWFSTFAKIQYSGPAIALSLAVALAAALTLAPVILKWFGRAIDWPFRASASSRISSGLAPPENAGADPDSPTTLGPDPDGGGTRQPSGDHTAHQLRGLWGWVANRVVRRPGLILSVSLLAMAPFAWFGAAAQPNYGLLADLPGTAPSKTGSRIIRTYFPIGELGPTRLLIAAPELDFRTEDGRAAVAEITEALRSLPEVATVRSLTAPLGEPLEQAFPLTEREQALPDLIRRPIERARQGLIDRASDSAEPVYVSLEAPDSSDRGRITRLEVVLALDPFSKEGLDALDTIQQTIAEQIDRPDSPLRNAEVGYVGSTAQIHDLRDVITVDQRRMYVLVTIGVYIILVLLLRRPGISLYLIATVVLGYMATLGLTDLVFQALHTGPEPWEGLDWKVAFFLFVILVAIGEDYNIFLMSRVIEEERGYRPIEATRRAVAATGGIISSCGLIMAGTFGSMLTGSLLSLRELGFALSCGVLLDTFVVRPILVPAFIVLKERWRGSSESSEPRPTPDHSANGDGGPSTESIDTSRQAQQRVLKVDYNLHAHNRT